MKKALIAMSGGVDSSVAAQLILDKGYDTSGITMEMFCKTDGSVLPISQEPKDEVSDARQVCKRLGIEHIVLGVSEIFREHVLDKFVAEYRRGRTPNPCVYCNRYIKFGRLLEYALSHGQDYIVTGHYAKIEKSGERFLLKCAVDKSKDQTYFLYQMTQHELAHTLFPLGELSKAQVREIAEAHGFITAKKRDSQDICFAPTGHFDFIKHYTGEVPPVGNFVDLDGNVIGSHRGILKYTIGQRKGLGMGFGRPVYVCGIDAEDNTVTLGDEERIFSCELRARDINLIAVDKIEAPMRVKAKVRYAQIPEPATVIQTGEDEFMLTFDNPVRAITPGQAVVMYDADAADTVIGGGIIQ